MSDSPIFDMLDSERSYTKTMDETKRALARHVNPLFVRSVPVPDEVEEIFVKPFVPVREVRRGTFGQALKNLTDQPAIELTAKSLEAQAGQRFELIRMETKIDILEDGKQLTGNPFTDFALGTIKKFRADNPGVDRVNFFVDLKTDGTEMFVVEGQIMKKDEKLPDIVMVKTEKPQEASSGVLADYRAAVTDQCPGFIPMAVKAIQEHEEGPEITSGSTEDFDWSRAGRTVQLCPKPTAQEQWNMNLPIDEPLSEKNTAQTTE
jgi:hypothetical protein